MSATQNYGFETTVDVEINGNKLSSSEISAVGAIDRELKRVENKADQNSETITTKVDKVDGHSLISAVKLEQITENKNHIECLSTRLADAKTDITDRYTKAETDAKLECKASKCEFEKHIIDPHAHQEVFDQIITNESEFRDKINSINIHLDNKVDKIPGCGLIPEEQLVQIETNKNDISKMYTQSEVDTLLANKVNNGNEILQWNTLPPPDGWSSGIFYAKDSVGTVFISINMQKATTPSPAEGLGSLPVGFRPQITFPIAATTYSSNICTSIHVNASGFISFPNTSLGIPANTRVVASVSFKAK